MSAKRAVSELLSILIAMFIVVGGALLLLMIFTQDNHLSKLIIYFVGVLIGLFFGIILKNFHDDISD